MKIRELIERGIYFYSDNDKFSYVALSLADGLNQLGIPIYANKSWQNLNTTDFSFEANEDIADVNKCYCAVIDLHETCEQYPFQIKTIQQIHSKTIAMSMHDNIANFLLDDSIPFLCTHENEYRNLDGFRIPIGFGVCSKFIERTSNLLNFVDRGNYVLRSFRPSGRQDVRACLDLILLPNLAQYIPVETHYTDRQHEFIDLLKKTAYCLSYGGCFDQNLLLSPYFKTNRECVNFYSHIKYKKETIITRWDSWRFWESLVAGCLTIHLDFNLYGFKLPVKPENWKHYVGLNLANIKQDVERMMDQPHLMEEIAFNGRIWAIEHYSPIAVAKRFLKIVNKLYSDNK